MLPGAVIADPNPADAQRLATTLSPGFRCVVAPNLQQALLLILREQPALCVLE